jgi:DNA-binding MarR family transcriptional regulator
MTDGVAVISASEANAAQRAIAVSYGPMQHWVTFHLRMAQLASFQAFARLARGLHVSPARFALLMLIGENPGISQTALARAYRADKSTLTPAVADLARRGLVARKRTERDKRAFRLSLTPAGEKALQRLSECARQHDRNLDRLIGARDRARFVQILQKIAESA